MVVICEECGKIYKLNAEKLKQSMKGKTSKIKCKVCDHVIEVSLPDDDAEDSIQGNVQQVAIGGNDSGNQTLEGQVESVDEQGDEEDELDSETSEAESVQPPATPKPKKKESQKKKSGLGLRTKMFFLFLVIPITLMAASSALIQIQMLDLAKNITNKSTDVVKELAEQSIIDKAKSIATQCSIFLKNNPDLNKDDFYYNFDLKEISIQKVGEQGFTSLVELPESDEGDEGFVIWCHRNSKFIGLPLLETYKKSLGASYNEFKGFLKVLRTGEGTSGYYTWKDEKNVIKDRFVAIQKIEQSDYIVISSTYIEDFTTPIINLEKEAGTLTKQARNYNIVILIVILLIILLSITIYGYKLTNNIGQLTDAADRISVGELDVQIAIKSKDEIGALADAISRMQDSLRFSIERLRRRR